MSQIASDAKISSAMSKLGMTAPLPNLDDSQVLKAILVALGNVTGGGGGDAVWGTITGTLADQLDLWTALGTKMDHAGGSFTGLTGAGFRDASAAFDVTLAFNSSSSALTAGRTLTIDMGNAARSITLAGNLTVPTTGTAALLGTANVFTAAQRIASGSDYSRHGAYASDWYLNSTGQVAIINSAILSNAAIFSLGALGQITWQSTNRTDAGSIDLIVTRKAAATIQLGLDAAGVTNQMLTAASRITSDGVGANLTIAGGNGRGGAGGSLILSTYTTAGAATIGTLTTRLTLDTTGKLTFADAVDMEFNGGVGTKIGTTNSQKIGFWNATPIVQPTTAYTAAGFTANTSDITDDTATWDNYTIGAVVAALRGVGLLA